MSRRRRITVAPGEEVDVLEMDFKVVREEWNEYELLDGGRVRLKVSAQKIYRLIDPEGKPLSSPDNGDPQVIVQSNNQVVASD